MMLLADAASHAAVARALGGEEQPLPVSLLSREVNARLVSGMWDAM